MPDPVSQGLLQAVDRLPCALHELVLGDVPLVDNLERLRRECLGASALVGVGVAGTLLLSAAARTDVLSQQRLLALFPFMGQDALPYGRGAGLSAQVSDVLLRLGTARIARRLLSRVAVTSHPLGLQGVYPPGSVSWTRAAGCAASLEFVSLVIPPALPVTVVLNREALAMEAAACELLLAALNEHLSLGLDAPNAPDLAEHLRGWLQGQRWPSPVEVPHA
ncbi:hypothetical protein [Hydrogenophaga sp.]|uniref:hypothetical protein n=1 Tax=Hydrogenophaga sp. TaxID=1904254 RepID=UPI003F6D4412